MLIGLGLRHLVLAVRAPRAVATITQARASARNAITLATVHPIHLTHVGVGMDGMDRSAQVLDRQGPVTVVVVISLMEQSHRAVQLGDQLVIDLTSIPIGGTIVTSGPRSAGTHTSLPMASHLGRPHPDAR
jgi:hypothetical protein